MKVVIIRSTGGLKLFTDLVLGVRYCIGSGVFEMRVYYFFYLSVGY